MAGEVRRGPWWARDDFLDGLGSEAEAQQIRGEAVGRKVGAAGLGGDEIVVGEVEEGDKNKLLC